jgi:(p)ppGpp synthase/HD superfamily hydrolase
MIFKAVEFAARAHAGQYRKGTAIPYICHLMNVCQILGYYKCSREVMTAGILHDVLEDTSTTVSELEKIFGKKVTELVLGASEPDQVQKKTFKAFTWKKRKTHTLGFLRETATGDVLRISCADKLDNIRSIKRDYREQGEKIWMRFNAGRNQQGWYYKSLAEIFLARAAGEGEVFRSMAEEFRKEVYECFQGTTGVKNGR